MRDLISILESHGSRHAGLMLIEGRLEDLQAELAKAKVEYKKLDQNRRPRGPTPDWKNASDAEFEKADRYNQVSKGVNAIHGNRMIELSHQVAVLAAKVRAERLKGNPDGEFTAYTSQKSGYKKLFLTELGQMIHAADMALEYPAADAIDQFVGHPASDNPGSDGVGIGVMNARRLEDAYSDAPSERGQQVRQQLEEAFAPIREKLREAYGDEIVVHRSQCKVAHGSSRRNVLSWTVKLDFAQIHQKWLGDKADKINTRSFALEDIVWITDRANQAEFIMVNRDNHPG